MTLGRISRVAGQYAVLCGPVLGLFAIGGCSSGTGGGGSTTPQIIVSGGGTVRLGSTSQFSATVTNEASSAVTWQVNQITGGSTTVGTISSTGLYTPPAVIPAQNTVTITAVSAAVPTLTGSASEAILNPLPVVTSATTVTAAAGTTSFPFDVKGSGFVNGSVIQVAGQSIQTTFLSSTELQGTFGASSGQVNALVQVGVANPDPGASVSTQTVGVQLQQNLASLSSAARLLDQATFGPTVADIQHVEAIGLGAYLNEQFSVPPSTLAALPATDPVQCTNNSQLCASSEWLQAILNNSDQLRQRVAFALTEIFVTSTDMVSAHAETTYLNTLSADAFTNYRQIMQDVALSTSMGAYLNMLNSNKPAAGQIPNENFPRELMQLFTIGINKLNADGSLALDTNGLPIPNYTELEVQGFAKAYTGWTYANADGTAPTHYPNGSTVGAYLYPMAPVEANHDMTQKTILHGTVLPAGQTAEADLKASLDEIFNDPSVGPFVGKQLIQRLVKSNPSPGYISRISAVFANNGSGVRGDMKAVLTAILMDPEARAADTDPTVDGGHLREPILYLTEVMRALGFASTNTDPTNLYPYISLIGYPAQLGEQPLRPQSVFNFFPPEYVIPGTTTNAPEFSLENTATAILRLSQGDSMSQGRLNGFAANLSATSPLGLIAANPPAGSTATGPGPLVDTLNAMLMHGQMRSDMRTAIVNTISSITDNGQRVRVAVYLVITSSQYKIMN